MSRPRIFTRPARLAAILPYAWLLALFLTPFLFIIRMSLSMTAVAQPPYAPVFDITAGWSAVIEALGQLSGDNFALLISDSLYLFAGLRSLTVAAVSTALLLLIGYPVAYAMTRLSRRWQPIALMLVVVPFWTSFLIRVYAWINILQKDGLLNGALRAFHVIETPLAWLATDTAMYLGIVYSYLPFMILPLYAAMEKMDASLIEAAADLGCSRLKAFWLVTLPLSRPGIGAGALLCFIPVVGEFVIPDLLAGSDRLMIGQTVWLEFFTNRDWSVASAMAVVLLVLLIGPLLMYEKMQRRALERGA
ncbi:MAG: ABC transporter permease [Xanthobacteraceae bacterium]|nr:MAG: ABC transporter permease [Xanthobacteraceae bacterium]